MSVWIAVLSAVGAVAGVIGAFVQGSRSGRRKIENEALKDQVLTREEIDNATIDGDLALADRVISKRVQRSKDRK
jgi:hypothetical protein